MRSEVSSIFCYDKKLPYEDQEPVSRKSRKLFGPEKQFVKLQPAYSVNLVFSYVVKGIKITITVKFRGSRRLRFEDTKRIMSPEMRPKSFGTFEKRATGNEVVRSRRICTRFEQEETIQIQSGKFHRHCSWLLRVF